MNELSERIARLVAVISALVACLVSVAAGAGFMAVVVRSAVAFGLTWILAGLLVRRIFRTLLLRVMEDRKPGRIDITLQ